MWDERMKSLNKALDIIEAVSKLGSAGIRDISSITGFPSTTVHRIAATLNSCVRSSDMVARFGGEEFAVILVEMRNLSDAYQVAERMRIAVKNRPVAEKDGKNLSITISDELSCDPRL